VLQTFEPREQPSLVDAVQQSSHTHREITMTAKSTPLPIAIRDGGHT
jgi:hypothetical protein